MYHLFEKARRLQYAPVKRTSCQDHLRLCQHLRRLRYSGKSENDFVSWAPEFGWGDLGTWKSLYEELPKDPAGNAVVGPHVMLDRTSNCIVNFPKDKLAVIQGLENYIVVYADDVLPICPKTTNNRCATW